MGKALIMIHGRGPQPRQEALRQCWETFLDRALLNQFDRVEMVDYVTLWGYVPPIQPDDQAGCDQLASAGNPDPAAQAALDTLSKILRNSDHLPLAHGPLGWGDLQQLKDAAVEALWRQFARGSGNQFAIDVLNFFKDVPAIRDGAGQQLTAAIDRARGAGDDVLLLAHSFGTIVAYETLRRYRAPAVELLVTMGSPLAWCYDVWSPAAPPRTADYQQAKLFPGLGLHRWLNVYDWIDPVATGGFLAPVPHLAPGYQEQGQQVVLDAAIPNTYAKDDDLGSHHDWRGYLASVPVAQAFAQFTQP